MSLNSVNVIGRLASDPERRTTTSGKNVANFRIAVSKRSKPTDGSPDADFFNVNCWDKTAEFVTNYIGKGRLVAIEGRLQSRSYTASDGSKREVVEIVANAVHSLERPKDDTPSRASTTPASEPDAYDPWADE